MSFSTPFEDIGRALSRRTIHTPPQSILLLPMVLLPGDQSLLHLERADTHPKLYPVARGLIHWAASSGPEVRKTVEPSQSFIRSHSPDADWTGPCPSTHGIEEPWWFDLQRSRRFHGSHRASYRLFRETRTLSVWPERWESPRQVHLFLFFTSQDGMIGQESRGPVHLIKMHTRSRWEDCSSHCS